MRLAVVDALGVAAAEVLVEAGAVTDTTEVLDAALDGDVALEGALEDFELLAAALDDDALDT